MRILLTNNTLAERAGTELYIHDVALELLNRGHLPIAYSTVLGKVAEQLRAATVPVVDDLDDLGAAPDIIHGQHHFETLTAALHFPSTPVVNFCHGWIPQEEEPLLFPRVRRYVAVDDTCRDRLVCAHGIPPDRISVILNFVDTRRFKRRQHLPEQPRRALAFGNHFVKNKELAVIEKACDKAGLQLSVLGGGMNREISRPEDVLPQYDLVFAKARAALEAMAAGTAVILCGPRGVGPLVTPQNWGRLRRFNFGVRALTLPPSEEAVSEQISHYDCEDAAKVSSLVHAEASLANTVDQLVHLYEEVITEFSTLEFNSTAGELAASRHLTRYAATFKAYRSDEASRPMWKERCVADAFWPFLRGAVTLPAANSNAVAGRIDKVERHCGSITIEGWAADRARGTPCKAVFAVQHDRCLEVGFPNLKRQDVADHLGTTQSVFGFTIQTKAEEGPLRVLVLIESGELLDISELADRSIRQTLQGWDPGQQQHPLHQGQE